MRMGAWPIPNGVKDGGPGGDMRTFTLMANADRIGHEIARRWKASAANRGHDASTANAP